MRKEIEKGKLLYLGLLSPTRIRVIRLARFLDADPFLSRLPELLLRGIPTGDLKLS